MQAGNVGSVRGVVVCATVSVCVHVAGAPILTIEFKNTALFKLIFLVLT